VNRWPNFFVIGAGKSGTTSLYHYVKQHPQIFMSAVKEPKYFALAGHDLDFRGPGDERIVAQTTTTTEAYLELFKEAGDEPVLGEASTIYLNACGTAGRIAAQVPHARLVAILRHPADRAYSAYLHLRRDGYETLESFADALAAEPERIRLDYYHHWRLRSRGYYGRQLQTYFDHFPREQIKVYLYEDFAASPLQVLHDLFRYLGVDESFRPDVSARHNQSGIPRMQAAQNFLTRSHPAKEWLKRFIPERIGHRLISMMQPGLIVIPAMPRAVRDQLTADYRDDILHLQELIQRDLSHWLVTGDSPG
jgi:hypothetical protein